MTHCTVMVYPENFVRFDVDSLSTTDGNNEKKLDSCRIGTGFGVIVGTDSIVTALYSNGMFRKLDQFLSIFPNAMDLQNAGDFIK